MEHFITNSFKDLLHKTAKEQNFVDYNLDIKEISSGGANYTSKLFAVSITEGSNTLRLFCKVTAIGEKMRAQLAKIFTTEHFFYTNLGKMYRNIEDCCGIPDELRLNVSKYYGSITELNEEVMVLEDLTAAGYEAYDRFKSIDWPYAQAATRELAKLHACAWAYAKQDPEGFGDVKKKLLYDINMDESDTEVYATKMIGNAVNILLLQEKKDKLIKYFEALDPDTYKMMQKTSRRLVLCHGDYKPSNLMHKILEDGTVDIKVVDLQTMQAGSPIVDLLYFIIAGTDEKFRAQYFDKLLDHYYTELSAAMKRLQLNPDETFSREDFDCEVKEKLPYGLLLAVFVLPVLTVEMENAPQVDESLDISKFNVEKTSDLYAERLNGVVNDYVKWGILK
ncbi:unnamed protein product [Spodoptera littoralis]|uniref:CHK kinase-like domain-containing protein n=1 Tax=Spodoptera littoralis TaxID=7109 RepID=A0A9P0I623_SPOLI|nr:unnamed protein product [Spodoptera littoralis]CAH1640055.1 unnamed protein product [Spodoptera littoralis]